jgi:hypothetical protein
MKVLQALSQIQATLAGEPITAAQQENLAAQLGEVIEQMKTARPDDGPPNIPPDPGGG